ncbi:hypothetical protein RM697_09195 [Ichthyenterobacterium sp. W332]|uniref:Cadherin domain-containing protein n=1 Tax=Microcosmobacter mediterraneus TaxID=3075607 RepID=A0ABU2YP31_9FLAO|nr:hypothetical protein [Ichthyenterobacterium sp. W332]MDT0558823.1 hypothetical protein [Ichthyenterobacterium sp. W332]
MKTNSLIKVLLVLLILFNYSCSNDSEDDQDSDSDITIAVDEYPSSGTFLTELMSSLDGNISYTISSQTVSQSLIIVNDQLAVGDWLAFDYETNEFFEAEITASNGTETETFSVVVNINDVDDIWAFLNGDSRAAYENANDGDWVMIKESEYNDLANYVMDTSKSGASDSQMFSGSSVENYTGNRTIANDNGNSIPSNSYVFAFKYYSWINNVNSSKVKLSQDDAGGAYFDLGNTLPEHNDEFTHFVLKGSSTPTTSESFIGMYASGTIGVRDSNGNSYKWRNGDVENLDNTASGTVFLNQALSTTLKQWD